MDSEAITLINVFEIDSGDVELFLQQWQERAKFMSRQPGFRSLRLHRAVDGEARFGLVNVAEWDSAEALQDATAQDFFQRSAQPSVQEFAVTAHPATYRVIIETTAE